MYFLCCYGRGPWQHHGNGTIKIKTLIPQLHPARVSVHMLCFSPPLFNLSTCVSYALLIF